MILVSNISNNPVRDYMFLAIYVILLFKIPQGFNKNIYENVIERFPEILFHTCGMKMIDVIMKSMTLSSLCDKYFISNEIKLKNL